MSGTMVMDELELLQPRLPPVRVRQNDYLCLTRTLELMEGFKEPVHWKSLT